MLRLWFLLLLVIPGFISCNSSHRKYNPPSSPVSFEDTMVYKVNKEPVDCSFYSKFHVDLPIKVLIVLENVREKNRTLDGYEGGRRFGNYEHHLPRRDTNGNDIEYREWDVNPKIKGKSRGAERLITGSDGRAWYTANHYNTFIEVK